MASDRDREMAREWLSDGHGDCYRYEPREDEAGRTVDSLAAIIARAREEERERNRRFHLGHGDYIAATARAGDEPEGAVTMLCIYPRPEGVEAKPPPEKYDGIPEELRPCGAIELHFHRAEDVEYLIADLDKIAAALREGREPTKSGGRE